MQKYQSIISGTNGSVIRNVPVTVLKEDGSLAEIFLDREGQVPAPNPLATDSRGVFYFYAKNGRYSLRTSVDGITITDADAVLLNDPEEIATAGPIADAVLRAEAAAQRAEDAVEASGIPELVEAAQNAVEDAQQAVSQAGVLTEQVNQASIDAQQAKLDAESAAQTAASDAAAAAQAVIEAAIESAEDAADDAANSAQAANDAAANAANAAAAAAEGVISGAVSAANAAKQAAEQAQEASEEAKGDAENARDLAAGYAASINPSLITAALNTANAALPKSGGTMTGNIVLNNGTIDSPDVAFNIAGGSFISVDLAGSEFRAFGSYQGGALQFPFQFNLANKTVVLYGAMPWTSANFNPASKANAGALVKHRTGITETGYVFTGSNIGGSVTADAPADYVACGVRDEAHTSVTGRLYLRVRALSNQ